MQFSNLASTLPVNQMLAFNNKVKARQSAGASLFNFTIGDFDPELFPIPVELQEAIIQAYRNGHTNYPMASGIPELRAALSAYTARYLSQRYQPADFLVAAGGRPLIYAAYQVLVDPGDKVIFPVPSWNNAYYACFTQATPVAIETRPEEGFLLTAAALKPHIRNATLIALCSPQNPTGTCYGAEQLREICQLVLEENRRRGKQEKKLYVLYDQIYHLLVHRGRHNHPVQVVPEMWDYTIYIDALSKSLAATGLRVGWAFGPPAFMDKMKVILSHMGAWAPRPEQHGLADFLNNSHALDRYLQEFRTQLYLRLQLFYEGFMRMKADGLGVDAIAPQASLYLSVRFDFDRDMAAILLEEAGIALLGFRLFGSVQAGHWYRISVGTCRLESIPEVLRRIEQVLVSQLKEALH